MSKKVMTVSGVLGAIGLIVGLTYLYLTFFAPPEEPQFKVVIELPPTEQCQVGEPISVRPYLIYLGKQPVEIFSGLPLFRVDVYDMEGRRALRLPKGVWGRILLSHTLNPNVPFNDKDAWLRPYIFPEEYTFTLGHPGRYKLVGWVEFSLDKAYIDLVRIYSDPVWIEVAGEPD